MQPFDILTGPAAPLMLENVDTDVIIRIERLTAADQSRLGDYALEALRFRADGSEDPDFVLNQAPFRHAPILIAGRNFGCGSSREGAVVALLGRGIRSIIAPSFGDIFYGNCIQNGVLPVRVDPAAIEILGRETREPGASVTVNLVRQVVVSPGGTEISFDMDPQQRTSLLTGLDEIGQTMQQIDLVDAWQQKDRTARPWVWNDMSTLAS